MSSTTVVYSLVARDRASRTFGKVSGSAKKLAGVVKAAGLAVAVAAVAGGAAALKMAADFQDSMQKISGLVGASQKQVDQWSNQVLSLSKTLPQSPKELADAMFFVTSAGFKGAQALDVLKASARAAAAGLGDTMTVADAVTSAVNAYGVKTLSAAAATDVLTATVKEGKADAASLAPVLGKLLPIASEMKVKFNDVGAAIAALTRTGLNAAEASTSLGAILKSLIKPAADSEKAMKKAGLSYDEVRKTIREKGLFAALEQVREATKGNQKELARIFPDVEAFRGVLSLTGSQAETNAGIFERMADTTGTADKAFKSASKTLKFQANRALSTLQAWGIKIANKAMPAITEFARFMNNTVAPAVELVANRISKRLSPAFGGIGGAFKSGMRFASDFFDGFNRSGDLQFEKVKTKFGTKKLPIGRFVPDTRGERLGSAFRQAIAGGFGELANVLPDLLGRLDKWLQRQDWTQLGETIGVKLAAVIEKSERIAAAVTAALVGLATMVDWGRIQSAFLIGLGKGLLKGNWLGRIAIDLVDGFWNGFSNKWMELIRQGAIGALGTWFIEVLKKIFGVSSPSTVFYGIGVNVVQGLINGLRSKLPNLGKTALSLGATVTNKFKGAGSWLVDRGKQIVQGLISGINSKKSNLLSSVADAVGGVLKRWGKLRGTQADARFVVNSVMGRLVSRYNQVAKAFDGKTAPVPKYRGGGLIAGGDPAQLAGGGRIRGPGSGTSDSIPIMASNGEFMVNARQTKKHLDLLRAINAGADGFNNGGLIRGYAAGGLVGGIPWDVDPQKFVKQQNTRILGSLSRLGSSAWEKTLRRIPTIVAGLLEKAAKKLGFAGNVGGALRFAKAQDGKPYRWGAVGPGSYDCSGFMSAITNVLQGRHPYSRRFTTASFGGGRGVGGFARGMRSAFMVGVNPGSHMAGTLIAGGRQYAVEAGGRSGGVNFGPPADGAFGRSWSYRFGLTKFKPSSGGPPGLEGALNYRGGYLPPNKLSLVGERGMELVRFSHGTRTTSNKDTQRLLESLRTQDKARSSGAQEPIVIEIRSDGHRRSEMLLQELRESIKVRGGDVQVVLGQGGRRR